MAKEDTEDKLKDDQIPGGNDGGNDASDRQEQEAPKDVRGALRAAIKEQAEKEDTDESEVSVGADAADKGKHRDKRADKQKDSQADNKEAKGSRKAISSESKEDDGKDNIQSGDDKSEISSDEINKQKLEPVGYWKTKGKAQWDKIDTETQQAILAREQEVSQGFQQVSQRLKSFDEMEKVLAPRIQTIQTNGYTPAQVVDSLFQWMERLGNPNPAVKLKSLKDLATNFGINLNQLTPKQIGSSEEIEDGGVGYIDPSDPPPWFSEFAQQVQGEVGTLKKSLDNQKQAAADAFVGNWAKDKKYYGQVSQLMGQLLSSGAIPLKGDGSLDLDEAYDKALKIHPQVSAQVQQEREAEAKTAAKAKADKDAKDRAAKLASARRAGSGIRPAAPSFVPPVASKANGKSKPTSVRDSIRSALDEHTENA